MFATDTLRTDHHTIVRMLTVVQKAANCLDYGQQMSPLVFQDACDFFANFRRCVSLRAGRAVSVRRA